MAEGRAALADNRTSPRPQRHGGPLRAPRRATPFLGCVRRCAAPPPTGPLGSLLHAALCLRSCAPPLGSPPPPPSHGPCAAADDIWALGCLILFMATARQERVLLMSQQPLELFKHWIRAGVPGPAPPSPTDLSTRHPWRPHSVGAVRSGTVDVTKEGGLAASLPPYVSPRDRRTVETGSTRPHLVRSGPDRNAG